MTGINGTPIKYKNHAFEVHDWKKSIQVFSSGGRFNASGDRISTYMVDGLARQ